MVWGDVGGHDCEQGQSHYQLINLVPPPLIEKLVGYIPLHLL